MRTMIEIVEQMRARLTEITDTEQGLVRTLGEALGRVDQRLLHEVRGIVMDHEARRGAILSELQGLASSIGAFPSSREPVAGIEYAETEARPMAHANDARPAFGCGDWREAASNIEDELDMFCQVRGSSH